jgi:hypothetical protein
MGCGCCESKIKTAVITGMHPYDVPNFYGIFKAMPDVDFYPQNLWDFATCPPELRQWYDVVVFYNMHMETPNPEAGAWDALVKTALDQIGESSQGVLLLHHSILAWPELELWNDLTGVQERGFGYHIGETVTYDIAAPEHPITKGLSSWTMMDETYTMIEPPASCQVLITTEHERSMKSIAWTNQYKQVKVFCYQSGHDNATYTDASFRTVLNRGIEWLAGRI